MSAPAVAAVVGPLECDVVDVTGEDRLTYLDAVLTQRLRDGEVPRATSALELGPHGEPNGVLDLAVLPDRVVLLVPDAIADDVVGRLAGRTFMSDATFSRREGVTCLRVRGEATDALATVGAPAAPGEVVVDGEALWLRHHHGADVVVPDDRAESVVDELVAAGVRRGDAAELDAAEILAGVPRAPEEIARGRLPEELGLLPTHVHLDKGCYPGQEAVARMWMLGRPRRRLAVVELPAGTGPGHVEDAPGSVEVTRTADVGGRTVGLAFVGRDATAGDEPHPGVEVLRLVGDDLPVPGHDPAVRRRRDR